MTLVIRRAQPFEVERTLGVLINMPAWAWIGEDDGVPVGSCGLAWGIGRCWIWFDLTRPERRYAVAISRMSSRLKAMAMAVGETEIYATRDPAYQTAERWLELTRFKPTGEIFMGQEVYKWQASQ